MKKLNRALTILAAAVLTLSFTACSEETSAEPLKIGVPSDATNQARAISLLEAAGLIDVDDAAGFTPVCHSRRPGSGKGRPDHGDPGRIRRQPVHQRHCCPQRG